MAKKNARRSGGVRGAANNTRSQLKRRKRLQHFEFQSKLATRVNIEGWDERKSLKENYKNLGLAYDANDVVAKIHGSDSLTTFATPESARGLLTASKLIILYIIYITYIITYKL